ncbi:MAG: hypothetical protein U1E39_12070 [Planctomycetota bacterium]
MRNRPASPRRAARRRVPRVLAALVLAAGLLAGGRARTGASAGPDVAGERPRAFEATWRDGDGTARALYRPRFVPAGLLLADAQAFGLAPLALALDGSRGRILVSGAEDHFPIAADAFGYLDVPTPQVLVEVSLVETLARCRNDHGGHLWFDRGPDGPDTFFRAFRADFEPSAWLRSELVGGLPFQGVDVRGGGTDLSDGLSGTLDAVLRGLAHDGEADVLARPCLVCTEGVPATVSSTLSLPASLFFQNGAVVQQQRVDERAGVSLEVTVEEVGRDAVRLRLHPWVRRLEEATSPTGPASYPVLGVREATTTVRVADGETVVVAAFEGRRLVRDRRGYPALDHLPALDTVLSAHTTERDVTDVHVMVRVRILQAGRDPVPVVPPGEAARLEARRRAVAAVPPTSR